MDDIKVSVIVPVYNSAQYLRQCLDSIVGQSLEEIEIILVDDGSDDGSVDILKEYAEKDARIRVMYQEHKFAGVARNSGKAVAKGKYLVFWDSDDYFKADALKLMYEKCEEDDADICICGGRQFFDEEGFETPAPRYIRKGDLPDTVPYNIRTAPDRILTVTINVPWNKMFRRSFIEKTKLDFKPSRNCNDVYFVECAMCFAERITLVNKGLVVYRKSKRSGLVASIDKGLRSAIDTWIDTADNLRANDRFPARSFANRAWEDILHLMSNTTDWRVFKEEFEYLRSGALDRLAIIRPDDDEYYFIKWQNEAARRIFDNTPEEFDRYLANFFFARDAATTAGKRAADEKNKKKIDQLTKKNEASEADICKMKADIAELKNELKHVKDETSKLEKNLGRTQKELKDVKGKYDSAQETISLLNIDCQEKDRLIAQTDKTLKKKEKEIRDIKGSVSFKIGRGMTWFPRKVKKLVKGKG